MVDAWAELLQALEALVLRCPMEISPNIRDIIRSAMELVKYDPVSKGVSTESRVLTIFRIS